MKEAWLGCSQNQGHPRCQGAGVSCPHLTGQVTLLVWGQVTGLNGQNHVRGPQHPQLLSRGYADISLPFYLGDGSLGKEK